MPSPRPSSSSVACGACGRVLSTGACKHHPGEELLDLAVEEDADAARALRALRSDRWKRAALLAGMMLLGFLTQAALYDGDSIEPSLLFEDGPALWQLAVGLGGLPVLAWLALDVFLLFRSEHKHSALPEAVPLGEDADARGEGAAETEPVPRAVCGQEQEQETPAAKASATQRAHLSRS